VRATFITGMCLGGEPAAHLLLLCCPGIGNVPMRHLFDRRLFHKVIVALEEQAPDEAGEQAAQLADRLPPYDICFNGVGDADLSADFLDDVRDLSAALTRPVLNPIERIARTRRDRVPDLLAGIPALLAPQVRRVSGEELKQLAAEPGDLTFPLLLRPAGDHGGDALLRLGDAAELAREAANAIHPAYYLTDFVDYASADGWYRKYRLVYVDRAVFPYHLAVSRDWKLHYWRSAEEMSRTDWMRAEEEAFLADWRQIFGAAAPAVEEIGRRMDLDYAGLDCGILPDGRLVLFEANAQMLVHLTDPVELFPYKHRYLPPLFQAVDAMVLKHAAAAHAREGSTTECTDTSQTP
jgi:hypothetical protein